MKLAVDAATGARRADRVDARPAREALLELTGASSAAEREYRVALQLFPGYAYALDALAQVLAAKGQYHRAIGLERQAVDAIPLPQYVIALGDLYRVTGRPALARRQYALIGAIEQLLNANGVKTDLEIALFQIDHGIAMRHALERARAAQLQRPSIDGDDVLALGAGPERSMPGGARPLEPRPCDSAPRTPSSSSTAG